MTHIWRQLKSRDARTTLDCFLLGLFEGEILSWKFVRQSVSLQTG